MSIKVCLDPDQDVFSELLFQAICTQGTNVNIGDLLPKSTLAICPRLLDASSFDKMLS